MTKNNLRQHLRWLVDRGQPDFSSVDVLLTPPDVDALDSIARPHTGVHQQDTTDGNTAVGQVAATKRTGNGELDLTFRDQGDRILHDAKMAKLNLASSSASKPRMLSLGSDQKSVDRGSMTPTSKVDRAGFSKGEDAGKITSFAAQGTIFCSLIVIL